MAAPLRTCVHSVTKILNIYINGNGVLLKNSNHLIENVPRSTYFINKKLYSQVRKKQKPKDPRKNTQYPYVPGDPLQEDAIREVAAENDYISKITARNKKNDEVKLNELQKSSRMHLTNAGLQYEVLKEGDKRFGQIIMDLKSSKLGMVKEAVILEGHRLIKDAVALGAKMKSLYFCEASALESLPKEYLQNITLYKVTFKDMKVWADTTTPSGLLGIFEKPQQGELIAAPDVVLPITLIFDSLKDPGNAGTLIRTAAAIGCEKVITTKGSVNVWEPKVIRSAMGGHFCIPIVTGLSWSDVHNHLQDGTRVFLANSKPSHVLSKTFSKHLTVDDIKEVEDVELSESDNDTEDDKDAEEMEHEELIKEMNLEKLSREFHKVPLTVYDYSEIPLAPAADGNIPAVALIVGGETEGLSALAKKFAYNHYGHYVTIPMNSRVNSLNTGIAGSLILYELRKKLLTFGKLNQ
ncbi:rRNA methyltransferase 3 mitochondrial [Biomphalaria glabrata]|nr:rRNA methyltransferase 3; mitochondrial-like [Biomphalaria glabrata]